MKNKVIELLDRLANYKPVPKKIKFTWIDYAEIYEYDKEHNWYFKVDDHVSFSISNNVTLTSEFEIIEETKKTKEIELLEFKYTNTYGNVSQHKASERDIINKINELSKAVNYLLKKEEEK